MNTQNILRGFYFCYSKRMHTAYEKQMKNACISENVTWNSYLVYDKDVMIVYVKD